MKKFLVFLRCMFWAKVLKDTQFVRVRGFMPGIYVCIDSVTRMHLEIKRLSYFGDVYEVTHQVGIDEMKWTCCFHSGMLVLWSHDFEKSIAFIPEEGKLIYEGVLFTKTLVKN